ncbi:MAG: ABC transporter permease [Chloroflexi bacterium]|nr:ABC transporter permease [Chloroflexota bacterium]
MLWIDQVINGLAIGNIYALIALGFTLIFGVANLINFAHGSVFMIGAYVGWVLAVFLGWPFLALLPVVMLATGLLGIVIERYALRPLASAPPIAGLLSTIAIAIILDRSAELIFQPETQLFPSLLPYFTIPLGGITITSLDVIVAAVGIACATTLYLFLRFHRFGWAIRATAQDRVAAAQMGVDVNLVNTVTFGIGSALGGVAGILIGQYFASISPAMGFQFGLKGFAAAIVGGLGHLPGAIVGGLILGVVEAVGSHTFSTDYRNLFSFLLLIIVLLVRPGGLFGRATVFQGSTATAAFFSTSAPVRLPRWLVAAVLAGAVLLPLAVSNTYILRVLATGFIFAILAVSLNLVAGFAGQISLGHAAFYGIGAYAVALLMVNQDLPFWVALPAAAVITVAIGIALAAPALSLSGHYVAIATLSLGEIVNLLILNLELTRGPLGVRGIPGVEVFGYTLQGPRDYYWLSLAALTLTTVVAVALARSHLGRSFRAIREDEVAAAAYGVRPAHYKNLAFGIAAVLAAVAGGLFATLTTSIFPSSFVTAESILVLTMVVLGGMGNIAGSIIGALVLIILPEALRDVSLLGRSLADFRLLFYGILLLLLIRFRPQGLLGSS